jgi:hypothetical protein
MQSLSTALYPATDSGYRIQWGTYGVIVKKYLVFYLLSDSVVEILRVIYGGRDNVFIFILGGINRGVQKN